MKTEDDYDVILTEYPSSHKNHGEIHYLQHGKLVRSEFSPTHERHGEITFYNAAGPVRCEYAPTHECYGQLIFYKGMTEHCMLYAPHHVSHGQVAFYNKDKLYRMEFQRTHRLHQETMFFKDGKITRSEYGANHKHAGLILFYKDDCIERYEFAQSHKNHGEIWFFNGLGEIQRTEYSPNHAKHGFILFIEGKKNYRVEFASTHMNHGEIWFYEDGIQVRSESKDITILFDQDGGDRVEFGANHAHAGEILFFAGLLHVSTMYGPDHNDYGKEVVYAEWDGPYSYYNNNKMRVSIREFEVFLYLRDMKLKYEVREEQLAKERQSFELERQKSIASQRDGTRGEKSFIPRFINPKSTHYILNLFSVAPAGDALLPYTERGLPNACKCKTKTSELTGVAKTIREVEKTASIARLHDETIKKHQDAVKYSKRVHAQEIALQTANAILYCK